MAPACGNEAEAFAGEEVGRDPGEDRLDGEEERRVGGGQDGLGPALDGECGGGGEGCGNHEGEMRRTVKWMWGCSISGRLIAMKRAQNPT